MNNYEHAVIKTKNQIYSGMDNLVALHIQGEKYIQLTIENIHGHVAEIDSYILNNTQIIKITQFGETERLCNASLAGEWLVGTFLDANPVTETETPTQTNTPSFLGRLLSWAR